MLSETTRGMLDQARWEDILDYVGQRTAARVGGDFWPEDYWLHVHFKAGRHLTVRCETEHKRQADGKPQSRQ